MDKLTLFMISLMIIGMLSLVISYYIYFKVDTSCLDKKLNKNLRIMILISSIMFSISVGYFLCINRCGNNCLAVELSDNLTNTLLVIIICLSSILLYYINSISKSLVDNCEVKTSKLIPILNSILGLQIVLSISYFGVQMYNHNK